MYPDQPTCSLEGLLGISTCYSNTYKLCSIFCGAQCNKSCFSVGIDPDKVFKSMSASIPKNAAANLGKVVQTQVRATKQFSATISWGIINGPTLTAHEKSLTTSHWSQSAVTTIVKNSNSKKYWEHFKMIIRNLTAGNRSLLGSNLSDTVGHSLARVCGIREKSKILAG